MKGLIRRASTALIFVIVMLVGLFGGRYSFISLFAIITALCLWEYLSMVLNRYTRRDFTRMLLGITFGLTPFVLATIMHMSPIRSNDQFVIFTAILFFPFIFLAFIYELFTRSATPFQNVSFIVLGMVYIGAPFALVDFIAFEKEEFSAWTVFGLLVLTWMNDTGAYLIGSRIGKHPLHPRISPKKTWEGTIGGVVVTFIVAYIFCASTGVLRLIDWMALAAIVATFGTMGDLVESMLKRSVGVKDSGSLLPGHGGVLDRFDAFIFLLPFAAAYLLWIR
ncbi:MAG: phosphatidate cytidylyltransferase [Lewinellaceae bacterium]|nr:phosphatidate cytidylyltransferase [Saprospiraceae bacterium]MCB9338184.1 phosphatidate cytidylyltransferase [Lewinellaceae bacterium]